MGLDEGKGKEESRTAEGTKEGEEECGYKPPKGKLSANINFQKSASIMLATPMILTAVVATEMSYSS